MSTLWHRMPRITGGGSCTRQGGKSTNRLFTNGHKLMLPEYLRVHHNQDLTSLQQRYPGFDQVQNAIKRLTGHKLSIDGDQQGPFSESKQVGYLCDSPVAPSEKAAMDHLSRGLENMLQEIEFLRHELVLREAELATHVPVVSPPNTDHIASRLTSALATAASVVGAQAAGLYVLDDATTMLKLRSAHNLPHGRLLDPPRPLKECLGDLEALSGNTVVLEDTRLLSHWNCPEDFPSAVCIPVSSSSTLLGTMWVFCSEGRDFTEQETNLLEIVAGKIAVDLEREQLIAERRADDQLAKQKYLVADRQKSQLPNVKPLVDGWDISAWTEQGHQIGGDFHDWAVIEDGKLAVFAGDAMEDQLEAMMTATSLSSAVKANCRIGHSAELLIDRVNRTFWETCAGDHFASLAYAILDPSLGTVDAASCGHIEGLAIKQNSIESLWNHSWPLGSGPSVEPELASTMLQPGDAIALLSSGLVDILRELEGERWRQQLCDLVVRHLDLPADRITRAIQERLFAGSCNLKRDKTFVLVKRRLEP